MVVERYSHVLHLVSQVDGELRDGLTAMDAFRAGFPAGTLTGAPKVRAMEIIDEMEPERRGPYGGAVGYIGAGAKRMDLAITIRTCVIANGVASVQAAAGVVYDSIPEREFLEHQNKARALLTAIGQVRAARRIEPSGYNQAMPYRLASTDGTLTFELSAVSVLVGRAPTARPPGHRSHDLAAPRARS